MVDSISDMLCQIRNAQAVKKLEIEMPYSRMKFKLAEILKQEGYIKDAKVGDEKKSLKIVLKYSLDNQPAIQKLRRISKPGQRIYIKSNEIKKILGGLGISIVSTSLGLMTGKEARKRKLGGELICEIY